MVLDTLIEALRARLGGILSAIDQLASFGPLIAAMDAEAVVWARSSVSGHRTQSVVAGGGGSSGVSGGEVITGSAGKLLCICLCFAVLSSILLIYLLFSVFVDQTRIYCV